MSADNIADRAAGFGMPGVIVDGFDFVAVHEAAQVADLIAAAVTEAKAAPKPDRSDLETDVYVSF